MWVLDPQDRREVKDVKASTLGKWGTHRKMQLKPKLQKQKGKEADPMVRLAPGPGSRRCQDCS